jgi:hypothetical protein
MQERGKRRGEERRGEERRGEERRGEERRACVREMGHQVSFQHPGRNVAKSVWWCTDDTGVCVGEWGKR